MDAFICVHANDICKAMAVVRYRDSWEFSMTDAVTRKTQGDTPVNRIFAARGQAMNVKTSPEMFDVLALRDSAIHAKEAIAFANCRLYFLLRHFGSFGFLPRFDGVCGFSAMERSARATSSGYMLSSIFSMTCPTVVVVRAATMPKARRARSEISKVSRMRSMRIIVRSAFAASRLTCATTIVGEAVCMAKWRNLQYGVLTNVTWHV
jgi:hypothetical protein